jgi:hypothetical protein
MILNIIRWFTCIIYGSLTIFACIYSLYSNISKHWVNILMGLSALFLIIINFKILRKLPLLISSLLIIQICAILNGYYLGTNNMLHHITRLILHIGIFILFFNTRNKKG